MIILIIAEQRSGSTNLANSFLSHENTTVLYEPISNSKMPITKFINTIKENKENDHITLIKETFNGFNTFEELIEISDKILILYRENFKEQYESWHNAKSTGNWNSNWYSSNIDDTQLDEFKKYKEDFFNLYLKDKKFFSISYEDIYFRSKINELLSFLEIENCDQIKFPYGYKYRLMSNNRTKII
jgi:hypothetical protein